MPRRRALLTDADPTEFELKCNSCRAYPCAYAATPLQRVAVVAGVAHALTGSALLACVWRHEQLGVVPPLRDALALPIGLALAPLTLLCGTQSLPPTGVILSVMASLFALVVAVLDVVSMSPERGGVMSFRDGDESTHRAVGFALVAFTLVSLFTTVACHDRRDVAAVAT